MQKLTARFRLIRPAAIFWSIGTVLLAGLLVYKLGILVGGVSASEVKTVAAPLGWHNLYQNPLYLPLKLLRAGFFFVFPDHGQLISRLPNVIFGAAAWAAFTALIRMWHGRQVAIMSGLLFATSAWFLHVSRLASYDVLYLWALPTLLLVYLLLQKYPRPLFWYASAVINGLLLFIPGMVWLVLLNGFLQRRLIISAWRQFNSVAKRGLYLLLNVVWLPLLIIELTRAGQLKLWLGLPLHLDGPLRLIKHLLAVPVHLFIRGPEYHDIWLGKAPILDIFTLLACLTGIYFYASRWHSTRSRLLGWLFAAGVVLVALGGPVPLSLLVPLLYMAAATGLAYLLRDWVKVFPLNPLARGLGVGILSLAVALSCLYNLRAYFIAWPHNQTTRSTFNHRL